MLMQVNQELCAGCGMCMEACPVGAIYLVDHRAVIDNERCTQCEACVDACPNGAIAVISISTRNAPAIMLPKAESRKVPVLTQIELPETATTARNLSSITGAALAFLGTEVAPRVINLLITALERKLVRPAVIAITPLSSSPPNFSRGSRGIRRQARHRGRRVSNRNFKERR